ncbi:MAG TPA: diacylglycerol kinase family protein [Chitinophagaceae bacterium]|nr:diacylglycerol kinase family protein [Chitinophagaceae bacterium]
MSDQKKIAIVCNPLAGSGRAITLSEEINGELEKRKNPHHLFKEKWPENFEGFTDVIIVGGDGTLNYFFNRYPEIKLPLAIFNGGTGNDVHAVLYGAKSFGEILNTALTAPAKLIDAGRCNNKYFINGVGIGFEGAVAKSLMGKNKRPGKASFLAAVLRKIFFYRSENYKVNAAEYSGESSHLMISVMNGHRAGGGFHVAPASAIDDGLLDVVMVDKLHPFLRLRWLPVIEKGNHLHLPFIKYFRTKKIVFTSQKLIQAHLDGEYYEANRLEIEMLPGKYLFRY